MNFRLTVCTLLSLAAIGAPASAQSLKPGLWEINNKMDGGNDPRVLQMRQMQKQNMAEMRKKMDGMPPEQRKHMEEMMAKLGQVNQMTSDGGMSMKLCVTPEMAARNGLIEHQREGCTNTRSPVVGGVMKVAFTCTKPASSGEGTVTLSGNTGYAMDMKMHITEGGRDIHTAMASKGKWLDSNCGDVKPPDMHPPKPVVKAPPGR